MGSFGFIAIIVIGSIVLFLITREFWCWYFKITERISLMEKQNKYFRLFLKNQNINFEDIDDIVIVNEQKKCNNCNKMVPKNLKVVIIVEEMISVKYKYCDVLQIFNFLSFCSPVCNLSLLYTKVYNTM